MRRTPLRFRRRSHDDGGSATIEVAVGLPVVMLLLMLVVQAGLYFHTRAVATAAAHRGLDAVRVEEGSVTDARAVTGAFLDRNAAALEARSVEVAHRGGRAEVSVSGQVTSLVFGVDLFPVRVTASAPVEEVSP